MKRKERETRGGLELLEMKIVENFNYSFVRDFFSTSLSLIIDVVEWGWFSE